MENLVSIIIPTYKRANFIIRTINSVLKQSYKNIEIIVVDDNNKDDYKKQTQAKLSKYIENGKIKYIEHDRNYGGCASRNTGLIHAQGNYICFLDDDDYIYKEKIERQVAFLEQNKNYDIVYCNRKVGNKIHSPKVDGDISYYLLSGDSIIITIMLMFRRKCLKNVKWNEKLVRNQEAGFLLDIMYKNSAKIGKIDCLLCETDLSDRSNALDAEKNEKAMMIYLKEYEHVILKLSINDKKVFKKIITHRYFGIALYYLSTKNIKKAIKAYMEGFRNSKIHMISHSTLYILKWVFGVKRDYYRVRK